MPLVLFISSMLLSAALLFSVQPMAAKALLPVYGGTPAVWTLCMLFFQTMLLCSYGYAWILSRLKRVGSWPVLHSALVLLSLVALPVQFHPLPAAAVPEWSLLFSLVRQLGLPLLVIGSTAPLLQFAYSQTTNRHASDPYFLYAASNLGSFLALAAYPFLIERFIGLEKQFLFWSIGYAVYIVSILLILYGISYKPLVKSTEHTAKPAFTRLASWVFLSFIPCSLLLGVTLYSTTDMAALPLFWVLPLALYLISYILAFQVKTLLPERFLVLAGMLFVLVSFVLFALGTGQLPVWQLLIFQLTGFFILAWLCHRQLFLQRPDTVHLGLFYLCIAFGGVCAGVFNGLIAPRLFNQVYEYPLVMLMSLWVMPVPGQWKRFLRPIFLGVPFLLVLLHNALHSERILLQKRSFYAVNTVQDRQGIHVFLSQSTVHGLQDPQEKKPINGFRSYYGAVEAVISALKAEFSSMQVTLVGLGTGTMLCQFREQDQVHAVEIDQQVIEIAQNTSLFTYLRDCPPTMELDKNDGRLAVAALPNHAMHLLILDAFNSDAVPVHLLTIEAFKLYKSKLKKEGLILVNISNRHLAFLPVINAMGRALGMITLHIMHKGDPKLGQLDSEWALLTRNETLAFNIMQASTWQFVSEDRQVLWTDDYSNSLILLRAKKPVPGTKI